MKLTPAERHKEQELVLVVLTLLSGRRNSRRGAPPTMRSATHQTMAPRVVDAIAHPRVVMMRGGGRRLAWRDSCGRKHVRGARCLQHARP